MTYSSYTTNDPNPLKARLQRERLQHALKALRQDRGWTGHLLDFGSGDGTLCLAVATRYPQARITCYEPAESLRHEAVQLLAEIPQATVTATLLDVPPSSVDVITCCEVFEHLPPRETVEALAAMRRLLVPSGRLVVGVPNEIYVVGLLKGLFRMIRRYGEYDARWSTVLAAAFGRPRTDRPVEDLNGLPFIFPHTGFDYRQLRAQVRAGGWAIERTYGSPFAAASSCFNSEVYLVLRRVA